MKIKISIVFFLAIIIIFPIYALDGAKQGLLLWFHTILPTLLPVIIISNLIIRLNITKGISKVVYPLFKRIFGVSEYGCYPILIGFLSGIPVGAKSINDLVIDGKLSQEEATYLLGFCNNCSPMFIMSFVAISQLNQPSMRYVILIIIYLSAILSVNIHLFIASKKKKKVKSTLEYESSARKIDYRLHSLEVTDAKFDFSMLDGCIMNGFEIITKVGGYIILFSIPAAIITNIFPGDALIKYIIIGSLEVTTGIHQVNLSNLSEQLKIVLTVGLTALGGISGLAQTKSVINESRLSLHTYFKMKILNLHIAMLLTYLYLKLIGFSM